MNFFQGTDEICRLVPSLGFDLLAGHGLHDLQNQVRDHNLHNCGQVLATKSASTAIATARTETTWLHFQCNLL